MKKIFSAFLLMTMMVFSVGSFVSCSDLENELAQVEGTANNNAAAIEDLNSELAALKTALSAAQADADAAMAAAKAAQEAGDAAKAEAEAAKAAAEQAKAEAIAAAMAEIEAIQTAIAQNVEAITNLSGSVNANAVEIEALQEEIKALQTAAAEHVYAITNLNGAVEAHDMAIADLQTELAVLEATLENYKKNLDELGLEDDALWTSISENLEAITNLQGRVDAQQMAIEDLMPAFEDVVAQVKTLNESLVVVYDILGVLANQIQSVVFVPEYDTDVVYAQRYDLNPDTDAADNSYTNYIATATYEVRPAKLAASLASENLSFACVDVKATKAAAAPEYFAAEVISADANTGRIVVAAIINDKDSKKDDNDYDKLLNGKLAMSLNIASIDVTELLIAESEPANVDMVSSEYVNVVANADAAINVGFKNAKSFTKTYSADKIEMPYNTPVAESVKALFESPVMVEVAGRYLTFDHANELLGTSLSYTSKVTATYADAEEKKVYPVKVNGKDITATATLVESPDYTKAADLVGKKAVASLEVAVVNGKAAVTTLTGSRTYEIVNKKSDITFASVTEDWKYTYGKTMTVKGRELAVNNYSKFSEGEDLKTFTATWKEGDVTKTATTKVTALSSKAVKFEDVVLPFTPGKATTYTFKGTVEHNNTDYSVSFDVTLGAMPEDTKIDLGTYTVTGDVANEMEVAVSPVTKAIEYIKNYDSAITIEKAYTLFTEACAVEDVEGDGVTLNGKDAAVAELEVATEWRPKTDNTVRDDKSTVTLDPVKDYVNTVVVTKTYEFCGVEFTYTATVKTEKPAIKFVANDVFVKNGVATVDGTLALPITKSKTAEVTGESTPYALSAIDLRNYVHVEMPEDVKENGYLLRYTLKTPLVDAKGNNLYAEDQENPVFLAYTEVDVERTVVGLNKLAWNLDLNALDFEIALVSASQVDRNDDDKVTADDDVVFGTVDVKLQIPTLVTFAAEETVSAKYVNGVASTANIVDALTIVDKFGNNVYNPYATTLNDLFKGYNATLYNGKVQKVDFTGVDEDFFNVYDMAVEAADLEDVKVYLNNTEISQSQVKFTYDDETGMILFSEENADITGDVKFEVPVTLTYMYDNYGKLAQEVTAVVVFSQNAEAGEGTEVSFPNPYGAQWAFEMCVQGEPKMDANGNMLDAEGNVVNREDYASIDDYFAAVAFDYPKSNAVLDLTGETLVAGVEMQGTYVPVLPYTVAYKVVPTDSTSGAIQLIELDRTGVSTGVVLGEIPYKDFDGQKCTFDLTVANLVDFETESGVVTATLVPEDEVITIGYPTGDDDLYGPAL